MRTELGLHVRYLPPADATLPAEQPVDRLVQMGTIDEQPHRITPVQPEAPAMPVGQRPPRRVLQQPQARSEEHTSELQSLMRISYAVFCLKKTKNKIAYTIR